MNRRRMPTIRVEYGVVNEGVCPQGDQVPLVNQENEVSVVPPDMPNDEVRGAFVDLPRAMTTQGNRDVRPRVNVIKSTMASRLRELARMNPYIFICSKVGEDPQEFIDGVYKVASAMEVISKEKAEFAFFKLREVAQVWYTQWNNNRLVELGPIE